MAHIVSRYAMYNIWYNLLFCRHEYCSFVSLPLTFTHISCCLEFIKLLIKTCTVFSSCCQLFKFICVAKRAENNFFCMHLVNNTWPSYTHVISLTVLDRQLNCSHWQRFLLCWSNNYWDCLYLLRLICARLVHASWQSTVCLSIWK